jgi:Xaa-Pro aminopeptidase
MRKIPRVETEGRYRKLQSYLLERGINLAIVMQNVDRFYFTGTLQDGILLVPCEGEPVFFVKRVLERAREESSLPEILGYKNIEEVYSYIVDTGLGHAVIGLEMDVLPAKYYLKMSSFFSDSRFVDLTAAIRKMRAVKSDFELSLMREGGKRLDRILTAIAEEIRPDQTELDVSRKLTELFLKEESSLIVRTRQFNMEAPAIFVLSGKSAAKHSFISSPSGGGDGITVAFPRGPGYRGLKRGDPVLIDVAFSHEGYNVDCTRIFAIGDLDFRMKKAHDISADCHSLFLERAGCGVLIPELFREVKDYVSSSGFSDLFMGGVKFVGHGVGLELDEVPLLAENYNGRLEDGMVIAFEPKFVFDRGTVGYENSYTIQSGKVKSLNLVDESIRYL